MSKEYIILDNDGLRRKYKSDTGESYGAKMSTERDASHFFNDEYVEWLESIVIQLENNSRLLESLNGSFMGGQA